MSKKILWLVLSGFILSTGAGVGRGGKIENVHALINSARKYGFY